MRKSVTKQMMTTDIRQMSMSMISTVGNFLPKKADIKLPPVAWVAVGSGGNSVAISTNGTTWKGIFNPLPDINALTNVKYGNGIWVAVNVGIIGYSTNGINWVRITDHPIGVIRDIAYGKDTSGNGLWVGIGSRGTTGHTIATSTDGISWVGCPNTVFNNTYGISVAYGDGTWIAIGNGYPSIARSYNGINWTSIDFMSMLNPPNAVAYGNGKWAIVGDTNNVNDYTILYSSTDGTNWNSGGTGTWNDNAVSIAYTKLNTGSGIWHGGGIGWPTNNSLAYSTTNTDSWVGVTGINFMNAIRGIAYGNGMFIVNGYSPAQGFNLAYSNNGTTGWNSIYPLIFTTGGRGIAYNYTYTLSLTQFSSTISQPYYGQTAISNSGKYMLIFITNGPSKAYVSNNYGSTFTEIVTLRGFTNRTIQASAMSGTGQYMVVVFKYGNMFRSGDYGVSWQEVTDLSFKLFIWGSVALSKDGKYCLASANYDQYLTSYSSNYFYVSSNFDTTTPTFTAKTNILSFQTTTPSCNAISNNGQYMIQINYHQNNGYFLFISSNYGSTFTNYYDFNIGLPNKEFPNMAMTPNASIVYLSIRAPDSGSGLYKSTNIWSGSPMFTEIKSTTFTETTWNYISTSSNGLFVVASTDAKTYYSTDSGLTWVVCYTGKLSYSAMSSDAYYVIASNNSNINSRILFSNR